MAAAAGRRAQGGWQDSDVLHVAPHRLLLRGGSPEDPNSKPSRLPNQAARSERRRLPSASRATRLAVWQSGVSLGEDGHALLTTGEHGVPATARRQPAPLAATPAAVVPLLSPDPRRREAQGCAVHSTHHLIHTVSLLMYDSPCKRATIGAAQQFSAVLSSPQQSGAGVRYQYGRIRPAPPAAPAGACAEHATSQPC